MSVALFALVHWQGLGPAFLWPLKALVLAVLCGYVFREIGREGAVNARSRGFPAVVLAFGLLHGASGALMGLGWCVARSMNLRKSDATPTKLKHFISASVRMIAPAITAAVCYFGLGETWAPLGVLVGATGYLGFAAWYGDRKQEAEGDGHPIDPDDNVLVERGQGAVAAAAASISLAFS
jgi:hypothetical protein